MKLFLSLFFCLLSYYAIAQESQDRNLVGKQLCYPSFFLPVFVFITESDSQYIDRVVKSIEDEVVKRLTISRIKFSDFAGCLSFPVDKRLSIDLRRKSVVGIQIGVIEASEQVESQAEAPSAVAIGLLKDVKHLESANNALGHYPAAG